MSPLTLWNRLMNKAIELYGLYDNAFPNIGYLEAQLFAKYLLGITPKTLEAQNAQRDLSLDINRIERTGNVTLVKGNLLNSEGGILVDPLRFWNMTGKVAKLLS